MAENNDVNKELGEIAQKAGDAFRWFEEQATKSVQSIKEFSAQSQQTVINLLGLNDGLSKFSEFMKNSKPLTQEASNAISVLGAAVLGTSHTLQELGKNSDVFQPISQQVKGALDPIGKMSGALGAVAKAMHLEPAALQPIINKMKEFSGAMLDQVDAAQAAQNAYLQVTMASGQGTQIFGEGLRNIDGLNAALKNQTAMLNGVAGATSVALPQITEFYKTMGQIPGAVQGTKTATGDLAGSADTMRDAINIAQGAGMNLTEATKQLTLAYDEFGKTGNLANEFLARQAELHDNLGIPIDRTTKYLDEMAKKFEYVGDNSRGASMDLQRMFQNLRDSGLGVQPALDLMEKMQTAMANLSVGQEAFISARSGGRGGLVGAFDIERELKEGKLDDVMKKQREAFKKTAGGHIATLEDTKTAEGAREFQKQRSMLMGGAFGGMNLDKNQASRLLEAMAKPEGAARTKDMNEAIQTSAQKGEKIAEQNRTVFLQMANALESLKLFGGLELLATVKAATGINNRDPRFQADT